MRKIIRKWPLTTLVLALCAGLLAPAPARQAVHAAGRVVMRTGTATVRAVVTATTAELKR